MLMIVLQTWGCKHFQFFQCRLLEICPEGIKEPLPLSATFPPSAHPSGRAWKPGGNHCSYFSCEETGLQSSLVEGLPWDLSTPSVTYRKLLLGDITEH